MKIRHSTSGQTANRIKNILKSMIDYQLGTKVNELAKELDGKIDDPQFLLELRKKLRDEVKKALEEKDDRLMHFLKTGQVTDKGHEPAIIVYAALIHYLMDKDLQARVKSLWG